MYVCMYPCAWDGAEKAGKVAGSVSIRLLMLATLDDRPTPGIQSWIIININEPVALRDRRQGRVPAERAAAHSQLYAIEL